MVTDTGDVLVADYSNGIRSVQVDPTSYTETRTLLTNGQLRDAAGNPLEDVGPTNIAKIDSEHNAIIMSPDPTVSRDTEFVVVVVWDTVLFDLKAGFPVYHSKVRAARADSG